MNDRVETKVQRVICGAALIVSAVGFWLLLAWLGLLGP